MAKSRRDMIEEALAEPEVTEEVAEEITDEALDEPVDEDVLDEPGEEVSELEESDEEPEEVELEADEEIEEIEDEPVVAREYPKSWKHDPELTELYNSADQKLVDQINLREQQILEGIDKYKHKAEQADAYESAVAPYMATIQTLGVEPQVAVKHLLAADHALRYGSPNQKVAYIQKLAYDYGVDLANADLASRPESNPELDHLRNELSQVQSQLQTQAQAQQQVIQTEMQQFAAENEHFEEVRNDMAILLEQGRATTLQDAYDKACWLNDNVRSQLLASQETKAKDEVKQKTKQVVQKAKKASVSVKGSGGTTTIEAPKTRREALEKAFGGNKI